jgi:hypothetical protein
MLEMNLAIELQTTGTETAGLSLNSRGREALCKQSMEHKNVSLFPGPLQTTMSTQSRVPVQGASRDQGHRLGVAD